MNAFLRRLVGAWCAGLVLLAASSAMAQTCTGALNVSGTNPCPDAATFRTNMGIGAVSTDTRTRSITWILDGGGSAITTSTCAFTSGNLCVLEIPFACTITAARMAADQTGSAVIEIAKTTYSAYAPGTHPVSGDKITSSTPPTISSAAKSQDTTLSGWTTSVSAGDWIGFSVTSATTIQRLTVSLTCVIP